MNNANVLRKQVQELLDGINSLERSYERAERDWEEQRTDYVSQINALEWEAERGLAPYTPEEAAERCHEWLRATGKVTLINDVPFHLAPTSHQNELLRVFAA